MPFTVTDKHHHHQSQHIALLKNSYNRCRNSYKKSCNMEDQCRAMDNTLRTRICSCRKKSRIDCRNHYCRSPVLARKNGAIAQHNRAERRSFPSDRCKRRMNRCSFRHKASFPARYRGLGDLPGHQRRSCRRHSCRTPRIARRTSDYNNGLRASRTCQHYIARRDCRFVRGHDASGKRRRHRRNIQPHTRLCSHTAFDTRSDRMCMERNCGSLPSDRHRCRRSSSKQIRDSMRRHMRAACTPSMPKRSDISVHFRRTRPARTSRLRPCRPDTHSQDPGHAGSMCTSPAPR
jgi:hypothetical protein